MQKATQKQLETIKELASKRTPRGEFLRKAALALVKAYLRGFYEGQVSKETPPSMESLVDEMLKAFYDKKADSL